jgi:hypothetical protein
MAFPYWHQRGAELLCGKVQRIVYRGVMPNPMLTDFSELIFWIDPIRIEHVCRRGILLVM